MDSGPPAPMEEGAEGLRGYTGYQGYQGRQGSLQAMLPDHKEIEVTKVIGDFWSTRTVSDSVYCIGNTYTK